MRNKRLRNVRDPSESQDTVTNAFLKRQLSSFKNPRRSDPIINQIRSEQLHILNEIAFAVKNGAGEFVARKYAGQDSEFSFSQTVTIDDFFLFGQELYNSLYQLKDEIKARLGTDNFIEKGEPYE